VTEQAAPLDRSLSTRPTSTGMARKVDDLGRIVLPVELRRMFGIASGDELQISVEGPHILLCKVEVRCVFCASAERLRPFHAKQVCASCAQALGTETEGDLVHPPLGDVELGGHGWQR
jgi:transcriptional pleiotropic regulator of transition state genes